MHLLSVCALIVHEGIQQIIQWRILTVCIKNEKLLHLPRTRTLWKSLMLVSLWAMLRTVLSGYSSSNNLNKNTLCNCVHFMQRVLQAQIYDLAMRSHASGVTDIKN